MDQEFKQINPNSHLEMEKNEMIVANFFLSVVWSIGAVLKQESKEKFTIFFSDLCENSLKKHQR
jgi:hypothetical protein